MAVEFFANKTLTESQRHTRIKKPPVGRPTIGDDSQSFTNVIETEIIKELGSIPLSSVLPNNSQQLGTDLLNSYSTPTPVPEPAKRRRTREERGLPDPKTLRDLAKEYLETQRRLWPTLVKSGILPRVNDDTIALYAQNFYEAFLGQKPVSPFAASGKTTWEYLAALYLRFSCDKSNPRSLVQQLKLALEKAASINCFVPWEYVFADAGVTGTSDDRHGYQLLNQALEDESIAIDCLLIDEIGRASRDAVEALRLGRMINDSGKFLIGVSDGFDSRLPMWKLMLMIFAALQEWFVDQLRSKVRRGMNDAHDQGTNLRPPAIGYVLKPAVDAAGNQMFGRDGARLNMLAVNEEAAKVIHRVYNLWVVKLWTLSRIAQFLNRIRFGNFGWDSGAVKKLLKRHKYAGINVENMTFRKRVKNDGGGTKKVVVQRPRNEWRLRRARNLKIVPWRLWKAAQKRLAEVAAAYDKKNPTKSRTDVNPTTLVRPICGDCGHVLWLGRSGKYASYVCLNGREGKGGCKNRGYKSVAIVENVILGHVLHKVLTEDHLHELVAKANQYLAAEAAKPAVDTSGWETELSSLRRKRDRVAKILDDEGEEDLSLVVRKLRDHERRIKELNAQVREAKRSVLACRPIEFADAVRLLGNARELLKGEVAQAATILREITGPVVINPVKERGKSRPVWVAEFTVNLVPVLAKLGREYDCPTKSMWEYLTTSSWTMPNHFQIRLETTPEYEEIAPEVMRLVQIARDAGQEPSINTIAQALGSNWWKVRDAIRFVETGKRPVSKKDKRSRNRSTENRKKDRTEDKIEAARLRSENNWSFQRIAKKFNISPGTAACWYDEINRTVVKQAAEKGTAPKRGTWRAIPADKIREICKLINAGKLSPAEIARKVGVSSQTVYRERKKQ